MNDIIGSILNDIVVIEVNIQTQSVREFYQRWAQVPTEVFRKFAMWQPATMEKGLPLFCHGKLLLQILRGEGLVSAVADELHLPAPPQRPRKGQTRRVRRRGGVEICLRILRLDLELDIVADKLHLPAPSRRPRKGTTRPLRGRRQQPLYLQVLRRVVEFAVIADELHMPAPPQRPRQGPPRPLEITPERKQSDGLRQGSPCADAAAMDKCVRLGARRY